MKGLRAIGSFIRTVSACGAVFAWASRGAAAPDLVMPEACGSAASFATELRARVGAHTEEILEKTAVHIEPDVDAYRLTMQVGDEQRTLRDPSCPHLFMAAVVVAASLVEGPS